MESKETNAIMTNCSDDANTDFPDDINSDQPGIGKKSESSCLCKCSFYKGRPCKERYSTEELKKIRARYDTLDHKDLDFVLLAKLECGMHLSALTARSTKKEQIERKQQNTDYYYLGEQICREMFKYMHNISQNRLSALIKHYKSQGIKARIHGNVNRVQSNAFSKDDIERVVNFVTSYAESYHHKTTGTIRKSNQSTPIKKFVLINCTKKQVYDEYIRSCGNHRIVSLSRFRGMWRKLLPNIRLLPISKSPSCPKSSLVKPESAYPLNNSYSNSGYAITSL